MPMKFKIAIDGERVEYPARRFSHYVKNVRFWFALHDTAGSFSTLTVSHWNSGKRVLEIGPTTLLAGVNMKRQDVARAEIDKLVARVGADKVYQVLAAAEAEA